MSRSISHFIFSKLIGSATSIEVSYVLSTYPSILGSELKTRPLYIRLRRLLRSGSVTARFPSSKASSPSTDPRTDMIWRSCAWGTHLFNSNFEFPCNAFNSYQYFSVWADGIKFPTDILTIQKNRVGHDCGKTRFEVLLLRPSHMRLGDPQIPLGYYVSSSPLRNLPRP
jgi:hypothetical protein